MTLGPEMTITRRKAPWQKRCNHAIVIGHFLGMVRIRCVGRYGHEHAHFSWDYVSNEGRAWENDEHKCYESPIHRWFRRRRENHG